MANTGPRCVYITVRERAVGEPIFSIIRLSPDKSEVYRGETVTFDVAIKNTGTGAGTFSVYMTDNGARIQGTEWSDSLAPGQERSKRIPVLIGPTVPVGRHQICVKFA